MKIQAYLGFKGDCNEALDYYAELFDANVTNRITYEDKKMDVPASYRKKLQHAELKGNGIHFMAYDASPDTPLNSGNQTQMSIDCDSKDQAEKIFNTLSGEGIVHHEFREREWGHYGRCSDKYGIHWMVNHS